MRVRPGCFHFFYSVFAVQKVVRRSPLPSYGASRKKAKSGKQSSPQQTQTKTKDAAPAQNHVRSGGRCSKCGGGSWRGIQSVTWRPCLPRSRPACSASLSSEKQRRQFTASFLCRPSAPTRGRNPRGPSKGGIECFIKSFA